MERTRKEKFREEKDIRRPYCTQAGEWAEHARFHQEDEPCDDGRAGNICGMRNGEDSCPL